MIINPYRYAAGGGGGVVVEAFSAATIAANANITATDPGGIQANELLILLCSSEGNLDPYTTTPAGWTKLLGFGAGGTSIGVFYKIATGSEGDVTVTISSSLGQIAWYLRISGVDTSTPISVAGTAAGQGNIGATAVIPEVTTTVDNCLAFYHLGFDGGDGYPFSVAGTGWTESDEQQSQTGAGGCSSCWGTKEQATAGLTGDATVTASSGDGMSYVQFAIAPA